MANEGAELYILQAEMLTPAGANGPMSAACVRAGISRYQNSEYYNHDFQPIRMACIPEDALSPLDDELAATCSLNDRARRLLRLGAPALASVIDAIPNTEPLALFLATPETLPGCSPRLPDGFIGYLQKQAGVELNLANSRVLPAGRAGGMQAIALAINYFKSTGQDVVIIGGIDSYRDPFVLGLLDKTERLLAQDVMDGFVPGEAAGFLVLATEKGAERLGGTPLGSLSAPALAIEPGHLYSNDAYRGDGLAKAFSQAVATLAGTLVSTIYSTFNGENFWAKEFGVALTRNQAALSSNWKHTHPAECMGDIGAASAPVLIGLAALGLRGGYDQGSTLVCCSSDQAARGAVCVH